MKIILTGATGMIGEGILLECLADNKISAILGVSRKPSCKVHPKLKEYIVPNFLELKVYGLSNNVIFVKDIHQTNTGKHSA